MAQTSCDGATIEVINWEKYNPRTDSKKPTWFRVDNDLATGPGFFGLDCEQKWLWIFILSLISQQNGEAILWNTAYCQQLTGIKPKKQDETIEIFEKFVRLRVSRKVTQRDSHATNERTNERDETNETNERGEPCGANAGAFLSVYCSLWKKRYGTNPIVRGKEAGIAKRLAGDLGTEKASRLIEAYLSMSDQWFLQKRHDLGTFEANLNAVVQFLETGQSFSRRAAQQQEREANTQDQLRRIAEGKL